MVHPGSRRVKRLEAQKQIGAESHQHGGMGENQRNG